MSFASLRTILLHLWDFDKEWAGACLYPITVQNAVVFFGGRVFWPFIGFLMSFHQVELSNRLKVEWGHALRLLSYYCSLAKKLFIWVRVPHFVVSGWEWHECVEEEWVSVNLERLGLHLYLLFCLQTREDLLVIVVEVRRKAVSGCVSYVQVEGIAHVVSTVFETVNKKHQFALSLFPVIQISLQVFQTILKFTNLNWLGHQLIFQLADVLSNFSVYFHKYLLQVWLVLCLFNKVLQLRNWVWAVFNCLDPSRRTHAQVRDIMSRVRDNRLLHFVWLVWLVLGRREQFVLRFV